MRINRERIDQLMAEQGLTVTAFAEKAGMARQNISTIRHRGTCEPRTAGRLAQALGVEVKEITKEVHDA